MVTTAPAYSAELTALVLALRITSQSKKRHFMVMSDSLSALEAIAGRNLQHPELLHFFELFTKLKVEGYNIILAWVPGHVGIEGNEMVDCLAKNATREKLSNIYIPCSDLKPKINDYVRDLWQEDWNTQTDNKLF